MRMLCLCMMAMMTGCATTTTALSGSGELKVGPAAEEEVIPAFAPSDAEENAALRKMLVKKTLERREAEASGEEEAPVVLDPSPVVYPPALAKMTKTADGCESGPGGLEIKNTTDLHLRLSIDDEEIMILGPKSMQVTLRPKQSIYVCLDPSRHHHLNGTAYAAKGGKLYEAECFEKHLPKTGKKEGDVLVVNYQFLAAD